MPKTKTELKPASAVPEGLSDRSRQLWRELITACETAGKVATFEQALRCLDRADAAAKVVDKDGMVSVTETTKAVHLHPLLKAEREWRALFLRYWSTLNFTWDSTQGRSPVEVLASMRVV